MFTPADVMCWAEAEQKVFVRHTEHRLNIMWLLIAAARVGRGGEGGTATNVVCCAEVIQELLPLQGSWVKTLKPAAPVTLAAELLSK